MKKRQLRTSTHRFGFGMLVSALALLAVATLAGCSKHDDDRLPGGKQPVNFTATMEEQTTAQAAKAATRATSGNTWTGGENVAVQIGGVVKNYIVINYSDGTLIPNATVQPFYWTSSSEQKSVSAWVPYSNTKPTQFTVKANQNYQNTALGYQQSDMIFASQTITFGNPSLTFRHLPAKVVVNIKNGKGITQADVQNATVTLLNQNLTSGAIATDWSVAQQTAPGSDAITPNVLTTATTGYQKTVQALLVPQTIAAGARMLQVSIGGGLFYYTPTAEQSLAAGNQYNYQITVNATGLSVTTQISDWTNTEVTGDAEMQMIGSKSDPATAAVGDFYFSDGSLEDKDATLTDAQKAACIGIVYSTNANRIGTAATQALAAKGVTTPHGLVMALTNASESCRWGNQSNDENGNSGGGDPFSAYANQLIKMYENIDGYGETQWIINAYKHSGTTLKDTYTAFYHASRYGTEASGTAKYAAPDKTTGWFIPSIGQWWDILENLGKVNLTDYKIKTETYARISEAATTAIRNINPYLQKIDGATQFRAGTFFWSSSEYSSDGACDVYLGDGLGLGGFRKNNGTDRVRCSLAF